MYVYVYMHIYIWYLPEHKDKCWQNKHKNINIEHFGSKGGNYWLFIVYYIVHCYYKYVCIVIIIFKFLLLFNYSYLPFLPIPPPHPSQTSLPPLSIINFNIEKNFLNVLFNFYKCNLSPFNFWYIPKSRIVRFFKMQYLRDTYINLTGCFIFFDFLNLSTLS